MGFREEWEWERDRRFYSAALIRAFVLQRRPADAKTVAAAPARGKAA